MWQILPCKWQKRERHFSKNEAEISASGCEDFFARLHSDIYMDANCGRDKLQEISSTTLVAAPTVFGGTQNTNKNMTTTLASKPTILHEPILRRADRKIDLRFVMAYQFDPLVFRMVDKYKWAEMEARECFEDLKRFLFMAAIADKPVAPTEKLDEMWHNFILYTLDYDEFGKTRLGTFVHHRPRRRDDPKSTRNMRQETLDFALELFGQLPVNFKFTHAEMFKASGDCTNSCSHSAPSTNCQS